MARELVTPVPGGYMTLPTVWHRHSGGWVSASEASTLMPLDWEALVMHTGPLLGVETG